MGWGTNINRSGKGIIWSTDCNEDTDSAGVKFSCLEEVRGLIKSIDQALGLRFSEHLAGAGDKSGVRVLQSRRLAGKWVICRAGGNWVRLSRDEIWGLRNELVRKLAT